GKMRMYNFPSPRMYCMAATRQASIVVALTYPACSDCSPKSPSDTRFPRVALPLMRLLWLLRCLTRFGISAIGSFLFCVGAQVDPHFNPDHALGRECLCKSIINMRLQRRQGNRPPGGLFAARHFGPAQPSRQLHLDAVDARFHHLLERTLDRAPEAGPLFELLGDVFGHELRTAIGVVDFYDLHVHPATGQVLQLGL